MRRLKHLSILIVSGVFLVAVNSIFGQESKPDVSKIKVEVRLTNKPLWLVFRELIEKYDIAIGLVLTASDSQHNDFDFATNLRRGVDKRKISREGTIDISELEELPYGEHKRLFTITERESTVGAVMDSVVRQMGDYRWEVAGGIVNISPKSGLDDRYVRLLEVRVAGFCMKNPIYVGDIRDHVLKQPAIIKFLAENKLTSTNSIQTGLLSSGLLEVDRFLDVEFCPAETSLKDLLNGITEIKRGGWILQQSRSYTTQEKEFVEIDI